MTVENVLDRLFPQGHEISLEEQFLSGTGKLGGHVVNVVGTRDKAHVGIDLAMQMAQALITIMKERPGSPILLLVDTAGQKMSRRDELLGLNGYIAHLAKCVDVARRRGHRIIGLVYGEAVSAGFLSSGLLADVCYALPEAEMRVMNLPAMSRVTKIPVERLEELSRDSAVSAPGVENYVAMGAVKAIWDGDLSAHLEGALKDTADGTTDRRRHDGEARGGRKLARVVCDKVKSDAA
ncbi:biotin-independent malonate decarboxylase subunit gamma [Allorhizobium taibaishanense]|uniref:Biotin-independent malonate decarboxylase subunit gamma n=1 Tax=Allorhizobium taibaishanense TaxID=887144 RepID=A0A1Q9A6W6_9HYPH|nr:biotin-independent malonate decarboxylase subunit gamma [Allorhizobium taibaishanense]MBB4008521.1 malonate decarboxylase gamma subunit [Allorhizobium taibaishanense]OLP50322.1 biotin-independent malonate decarboxylase subunit gamma [Allorhizobium taibaishanense]